RNALGGCWWPRWTLHAPSTSLRAAAAVTRCSRRPSPPRWWRLQGWPSPPPCSPGGPGGSRSVWSASARSEQRSEPPLHDVVADARHRAPSRVVRERLQLAAGAVREIARVQLRLAHGR